MSDKNDKVLTDFQVFCYERVLSDRPYFDTMAVFRQDKGVLISEIQTALSTITKVGSKCGSAVIVQSPMADLEDDNDAAAPLRIRQTFRILEDPMFNNHATKGTLKPALQTAKRLTNLFNLWTAFGLVNCMNGEKPTIVPVQDEAAPVAYEVRFFTTEAKPDPRRRAVMRQLLTPTGTASPTATATFVTSPTRDDGAKVFYTLDGTYPRETTVERPSTAIEWNGTPVAIAAAATLLAAAYFTDMTPSDVVRQDFT